MNAGIAYFFFFSKGFKNFKPDVAIAGMITIVFVFSVLGLISYGVNLL